MSLAFSISQLYEEAAQRLAVAGIRNAKQEALWLLEEALGVNRLQLHIGREDQVLPEERRRAFALVDRRVAGEPLQYVLGSQEFCGLEMEVNPHVLIPRPESELLVQGAVELLKSHPQPTILDVGTGSGCLAISVAVALEQAVVIASDRSVEAVHVAKVNARRHGMESRVFWVVGDVLAPLLSSGLAGKVTAIIANLPYIARTEWDSLSADVKDFEPNLALDGGQDGLEVYRRLLKDAPCLLAPDGRMLIEIGYGQAEALRREVAASGRFKVVKIQPDFQDIPRVVHLQLQQSIGGDALL